MTFTFDEYQKISRTTALYPKIEQEFVYPALGLAGESGELLNKIKKIFRDDGGKITEARKKEIIGELGDILWYIAQIATEFEVPLKDVAKANIEKLQSRKERNAVGGSGDER